MTGTGECCGGGATRADVRQRKLIETARRLFVENGFHATGVAQIARESGIAVGQIYRDFSSKEAIVEALVRQDCRRFIEADALRAAIAAGDSDQALAWLCHFVEPGDDPEGSRLFAEIVAESARNARIAAIFASMQDEMRSDILAALSLLSPDDAFARHRALLTDAIMTISLGMLHHQLMRPALDISALAGMFRAYIVDQLADRGAETPRGWPG